MDACPDSVPQDVDCKSCVNCFPLNFKFSHLGSNVSFLEDVGFVKPTTVVHGPEDTSSISKLVNLFEATLQVHHVNSTAHGELKNLRMDLDHNDMCLTYGDGKCVDEEICQLDTCCISSKERLKRSDAFPCKQEVTWPSQSADTIEDASCMTSDGEGCSKQGHISHASSSSALLPINSSQKLISAMKGSREQQGLAPKAKMSVKWAPDVYDPPVTLVSHTVKNSIRRTKVKKDKHKHKQKGGKVSRGGYTGRKQSNRITAINNDLQLRLQGPAERFLLSSSSSSATKLVEFALNSNESKCGNSFLVNPLAKLHIPVGRAS